MTTRRAKYRAYLASDGWRERRDAALDRAGRICTRCFIKEGDTFRGAPEVLEVHHRTYERVGAELPEDLEVLCRPCHKVADAERKAVTMHKVEERIWSARVTGWARKVFGDDEARWPSDVEERFERWLEEREES